MTGTETKKRGFLKDSSIYLSATVVSTAVGFITLPIYTRYLSPADYGIVALFLMFGMVLSGLLSFGIQTASYRYYFKYKENIEVYRILNSTNLLFLLFLYLLGGIGIYYLASWLSSTWFDGRISGKLIRWSFLSGCMNYLFTYFLLILTAQLRSVAFAIITILRAIINAIFSLYFIFLHSLTYLALIYATLLTQGIMIVCLLILTRDLLGVRFSSSSLKKSLRFSYPLVLRQLLGLIHQSFDRIMLTNYTGLVSVGYYTFGEKFATLLKFVMDSVGRVWSPFFFNKAHENTREAEKAIVDRFLELAFFFILIGLGIIYFSEEMIKLLTTKEFYPSMYVVPIFVYYYLFGVLGMLSVNQIQFAEKMHYLLPASIVSVILNIILNLLLIPKHGAIGAVIALAFAALFASLTHLYFGFRAYPLPLSISRLAGLFILVVAFTVPIYPIMTADINFILKVVVKLVIILLFVMLGLKLNYVSQETIKLLSDKLLRQIVITNIKTK